MTSALLPSPGRVATPGRELQHLRQRLAHCRDRLATRVTERIGADGLLQATCESRVLESSLALRLLAEEGADPEARRRLADYLRTALDARPPDPVQRALGLAALGLTTPGDTSATDALDAIEHFTADRKRLMFRTMLAELGAAEFPRVPPGAFDGSGQQSWLHLEMTALRVLAADGAGDLGRITGRDWAALAPATRPGPAWEGNNLARLLGLLALRKHPGHRRAVRRALPDVVSALRPDGGLPFITGMDVFATATAGLALTTLGPAGPAALRMADALAARQNPDGGFGFHPGVRQSDVDDTSYGIEFLRAARVARHRRTIDGAESYLLAQRNPDGGFPTFTRGAPSEIAMTAAAVNALAPDAAHASVVEQGVRFITAHQQEDGSFERGWSRNATNAVFRAVLACDAAPVRDALRESARAPGGRVGAGPAGGPAVGAVGAATRALAKERAVRHLTDVRNDDGGWGHLPGDPSDPISTAYAVIALGRGGGRPAVYRAALEYLLDRQQPDGGYLSRPDQAGPRPLLYDVPVLADVSVLLGLAHATAAARP